MSDKMKSRRKTKPQSEIGKLKDLPHDLDAELFLVMWNGSSTMKALSERLGVSPSTCALAAARLRKLGHELKWFRKGRPRLLKM